MRHDQDNQRATGGIRYLVHFIGWNEHGVPRLKFVGTTHCLNLATAGNHKELFLTFMSVLRSIAACFEFKYGHRKKLRAITFAYQRPHAKPLGVFYPNQLGSK